MRKITCPACKTSNPHEADNCAQCGESLALAKLQAITDDISSITARFEHQQAAHARDGFSSINGFGTTLLDYRPREDGTWDAARWVIAAGIPLVPLGGYVIRPHHEDYSYPRRTASFSVVERTPLSPLRVLRIYGLIVAGVLPLVLGWMNSGWLDRTVGGPRAFLLMLVCVVWAGYMVFMRTRNDSKVYKPLPPRVAT